MDPRHLFVDQRLTGGCAYCGGTTPTSSDHVPSKAFLDEPYPADLPTVPACEKCNSSFSLDEEYVACLLECVLCGSTDAALITRDKIRRALTAKPRLAAALTACREVDPLGTVQWQPEAHRVRRIILKLARGHAAFELWPQLDEPSEVWGVPLVSMLPDEIASFTRPDQPRTEVWPEIGSRSFLRAAGALQPPGPHGWLIVQPGRYRYRVYESRGVMVDMLLSEYLACRVAWD